MASKPKWEKFQTPTYKLDKGDLIKGLKILFGDRNYAKYIKVEMAESYTYPAPRELTEKEILYLRQGKFDRLVPQNQGTKPH